MKIYRNWIEEALKARIEYVTRALGSIGGRKYYEVGFADGSKRDYFIDFDNDTIEEV